MLSAPPSKRTLPLGGGGAALVTVLVGLLSAESDHRPLGATSATIVYPTSPGCTAYVARLAFVGESAQEPFWQRFHAYWKLDEAGFQEPLDTVSVWPACGVPEITGGAVFVYPDDPEAGEGTTAVGVEVATVLPNLFLAVTATRRLSPASALPMR